MFGGFALTLAMGTVYGEPSGSGGARQIVGVLSHPCAPSRQKQPQADASNWDWANLCRYREDNREVIRGRMPIKVVFVGDSITEGWKAIDPTPFVDGVLDRGISGQTTPQMLLRFRADVIDLRPAVVHILAGTNDIAGNTGPTTLTDIENNIRSMVDLARVNGIRVILGSVTPAATFPWRPQIRPVADIRALNSWLAAYARRHRLEYVDYYAKLADRNGAFKAGLSVDGVHPNRAGYAVMDALVRGSFASAKATGGIKCAMAGRICYPVPENDRSGR